MAVYAGLIQRWSLSGDEYFTLVDSSKPVFELLSYERKPLYYLICHVLLKLDLGLPVETVVRIPAAIAGSLIAPTMYWMLSTKRSIRFGFLAAVIALLNPWLVQLSQFARFYTLAFLFTTIAVLAGYRWLEATSAKAKRNWLIVFFVSGVLAGLSHLPAILVIPGGCLGAFLATFREQPKLAIGFLRRWGIPLGLLSLVAFIGGVFFLKDVLHFWYTTTPGGFGNYNLRQILISLLLFGGVSTWILATLPLLRVPTSWESTDVYFFSLVATCSLPILMLVGVGGGVASVYTLFCLPGVFVLAAKHWREMDDRLPSWGYRLALAIGLLTINLPYVVSAMTDGDHYDYRAAAKKIDEMDLERPLVLASASDLLDYYVQRDCDFFELKTFQNGILRDRVVNVVEMANEQQRPMLIVSREDRHELSVEDQDWFYSQFSLVHAIHTPRFDHRRHQLAIYRYRPNTMAERSIDEQSPSQISLTMEVERSSSP